ncbi:MAG: tryptophan--tRNA ligase [Oscillospiraceae bacterium]|nr:tryptophan--tRNA ligase [Oscillospiraceae bacterium]
MKEKTALSLITPSNIPTLGNYLGALRNWKQMAEDNRCFFGASDLHAITVRQDPKDLRRNTAEIFAVLLALELDKGGNTVFVQSHVPQHAQLAWALNCFTQFGEASRMTQFKDKSASHADNINVGLFSYPVLMAADIVLYDADYVPIGEDQKQHLELARNIVDRINGIYGDVLKVPEPWFGKTGKRIMSLLEPTKKMSKSDPNPKAYISLMDEPNVILKKMKSAVTDMNGRVFYGEDNHGVKNLMDIYSCCTGLAYDDIEKEFEGKGYGDFKAKVAEAVIEELRPLKERYDKLINEKAYLEECMKKGAGEASAAAEKTYRRVMEKVGFYQL